MALRDRHAAHRELSCNQPLLIFDEVESASSYHEWIGITVTVAATPTDPLQVRRRIFLHSGSPRSE